MDRRSFPTSLSDGALPTPFVHLQGSLAPDVRVEPAAAGKLVLSQISSGQAESPARNCIALKYVAAGTEYYRLGERVFVVEGNSFLFVPEMASGEAGRSTVGETAFGLCVYLPEQQSAITDPERLEEPVAFPAHGSKLGRRLERVHRRLHSTPDRGTLVAGALMSEIDSEIEFFMADAIRSIESIDAVKRSTRYENFRRLNIARAYLHDVDDRAVDLSELARTARMSRFQLARQFADQFGLPPSSYHRQLRLERARDRIARGKINCTEAAFRYGFHGTAQFSRAFRRAFGVPPSQVKHANHGTS